MAFTFCTTGMFASRKEAASSNSAKRSPAGAIRAQCEGTLTSNGTTRRAPAAEQRSPAAATAAAAPAITTCPGAL